MKTHLLFITLIVAASCTKPNSKTETVDSTQTSIDTVQTREEPVPTKQPDLEKKDADKITLDEANLAKFSFVTQYTTELTFLINGKVRYSRKINEEETIGTWRLSGSSIQVAFELDTSTFEVKSFKEDELILVTPDGFGGKLFGEVRQDLGEYRGLYFISLYRVIFSAPYSEDQVSGGWQAREGGCSFEPGGTFSYRAADCNVTGTWEFDGENFAIELTQKECGWSDPFDTSLKVVRLTRGLMLVEASKGIEAFRRQ